MLALAQTSAVCFSWFGIYTDAARLTLFRVWLAQGLERC